MPVALATLFSSAVFGDTRRMPEVFDIIHFFRLGLERDPSTTVSDVMRFAGAWEGMEDPKGFEVERRERRHTAFASRCRDETRAD